MISPNCFIWSSWATYTSTFWSAILIFIFIVVVVRVNGLKTFAKMSSFDFAITIAIGSILASTVISTTSVSQGFLALTIIVILKKSVALLKTKSSKFKSLVTNEPVLLMDGKEILHDNLKLTQVTEEELIAKLREANVIDFNQVLAVVFETTGDVSVLHCQDDNIALQDKLLQGVKR